MENWGSKRHRKTGASRPGNLACFRVLSAAREAGVPVSGPGRPPSMPDAAHAGLHTLCHFATIVSFFEDFVYLFLERGEGREKERERNWPATQACAPAGNRTYGPLVSHSGANAPLLSEPGQGSCPNTSPGCGAFRGLSPK